MPNREGAVYLSSNDYYPDNNGFVAQERIEAIIALYKPTGPSHSPSQNHAESSTASPAEQEHQQAESSTSSPTEQEHCEHHNTDDASSVEPAGVTSDVLTPLGIRVPLLSTPMLHWCMYS